MKSLVSNLDSRMGFDLFTCKNVYMFTQSCHSEKWFVEGIPSGTQGFLGWWCMGPPLNRCPTSRLVASTKPASFLVRIPKYQWTKGDYKGWLKFQRFGKFWDYKIQTKWWLQYIYILCNQVWTIFFYFVITVFFLQNKNRASLTKWLVSFLLAGRLVRRFFLQTSWRKVIWWMSMVWILSFGGEKIPLVSFFREHLMTCVCCSSLVVTGRDYLHLRYISYRNDRFLNNIFAKLNGFGELSCVIYF